MNEQQQGTPQVQIVLPDKFGGQKQETVKVDSNRLSVDSERIQYWKQALSIPARWEDVVLQACSCILSGCFVVSGLRAFPLPLRGYAVVILPLMILLVLFAWHWQNRTDMRWALGYVAFLVGVGVGIAWL